MTSLPADIVNLAAENLASPVSAFTDNIITGTAPVAPSEAKIAAAALEQVHDASLNSFPPELKAVPWWVVWKYETRDGKQTKVPYNPRTRQRAKSTDPSTWADYQAAVAASAAGAFQGVGCVIQPPYAAIDLDKCRNAATGVTEPWAEQIIAELNSYTELSPSGRGFHIWIKGSVPEGGNRKGRVEMYDRGRYFTVNGDHVLGTPLTIEARDLTALHARMIAGTIENPQPTVQPKTGPKPTRDDLMAGRWQGYYTSQSEADFALCTLLAVEFNGDPARIDGEFRKSVLHRPKWNEKRGAKTYGETTIENAIERWRKNGALCIVEEEPAPATSLPVYPAAATDSDYIGELTHILTDGTALPLQLVRENAKCILGSIIDGHVGFPGHEDIHLRHYTLNVSTHPRVGKGESWKRTGDETQGALRTLLLNNAVTVVDGGLFGSGEYMVKTLSECAGKRQRCDPDARVDVLARFDEMSEPLEKAKTTASTLETKLLTLFERNSISSGSYKNGEHRVKSIHFSLSGDFTVDSFNRSFAGRGSGGNGFLARCTIAFADRIASPGDWKRVDQIALTQVIRDIECCISTVRTLASKSSAKQFVPEETPTARDMRWEFWRQLEKEDPKYVVELKTHFKRDLLLRAIFSKDQRLDEPSVKKSIAWAQHQLDARKELWPEDAGGPVERMEQRTLAALKTKGTLSKTRLRDHCHVNRPGSGGREVFNRAVQALLRSGDIRQVGQTRKGTPVYAISQ